MIPKIIHHVWPGDDPFREKFHAWRESWMRLHPDWTFYFSYIRNTSNLSTSDLGVIAYDGFNNICFAKEFIFSGRLEVLQK